MKLLYPCLIALAAASAATPAHAAPPPTLEDLLRRPQYEAMNLSPTGEYIATRVPLDDRTVLALVRRADMKVTASVDPDQNGFVDSSYWVSDTQVFVDWSKRFSGRAEPYDMGSLYSIDVEGKNRRALLGRVIDPLVNDPEHVLIVTCVKVMRDQCITRLNKVRIDTRGTPEDIVDGAVPEATFLVDRLGNPHFSWGYDNDDVQKVFLRRGDAWVSINDEAQTGVEVSPIGVSHDRRAGFLWSERKSGPDVIERIDLATGERRVVASDPQANPRRLVWSFDRSEPIGAVFGEGPGRVRFFDDAHPHAVLLRELEKAFPDEIPFVSSASRDGRSVLVTVVGDREPGRFYLLDTASGDLKLLARSRPWLSRDSLSPMRPISLKARDGLDLHGYLTLPQAAAGAAAPLVVLPHGGPFGIHDTWGYSSDVQMLAARGYAVLQVNFRGSGGRGRDFTEMGYRQWGGSMQDDLTDATRWAMTQPGVDGSRVCVWGESYGGYAALMGTIREPDLYRCAIGMAGPYDLPTIHRWGDVRRSIWGKGRLQLTLGDDTPTLLAQSPTRHAGAIKAAVMLVQGGKDQRVSPMHARAMRQALDEAGKKYEGYFPAEETHGFYADKSRHEYYSRVLDFLDRHLRTPAATAATSAP
jgi:dipeptidyl aminopeptidase/acylaminoacyl peptidase